MKSIQVENVSKRFMLHRARPKNLAEGVRSAFTRGKKQEFWALKDIDFSVEEGGSLGIIGHNRKKHYAQTADQHIGANIWSHSH